MLMFYLSLLEGDDNKALFTAFYTRYRARLYAVALNILKDPALAEDAVHEAFLRVIGHFETFLKIFEKERNKIGPWAVTIVKNISLDPAQEEKPERVPARGLGRPRAGRDRGRGGLPAAGGTHLFHAGGLSPASGAEIHLRIFRPGDRRRSGDHPGGGPTAHPPGARPAHSEIKGGGVRP